MLLFVLPLFLGAAGRPWAALQMPMWLEREGIVLIFITIYLKIPSCSAEVDFSCHLGTHLFHKNPLYPLKFHLLNDFYAGKLDLKGRACSICPTIVRLSREWLWQSWIIPFRNCSRVINTVCVSLSRHFMHCKIINYEDFVYLSISVSQCCVHFQFDWTWLALYHF